VVALREGVYRADNLRMCLASLQQSEFREISAANSSVCCAAHLLATVVVSNSPSYLIDSQKVSRVGVWAFHELQRVPI
jgi:hypothetical protein